MKRVAPSRIDGTLAAPASKSVLQRLAALAVLTPGLTVVDGASLCDDVRASLGVAAAMGVRVGWDAGRLLLDGPERPLPGTFDCGESGLCLRMFSAVAALLPGESVLQARGSLRGRPVSMLVEPLRALGVACDSRDGLPPVTLRGPLAGGRTTLRGDVSSQFLTGLLVALPRASADTVLDVVDLKSTPYVELTLDLVARAGATVVRDGFRRFQIAGGQAYRPTAWVAEGDWSGAAFPLVAGAIAGAARVTGLDPASRQADVRILDALRACGAGLTVGPDAVECRAAELRAFSFDATDCPDLLPPLVALAAHCDGVSVLRGSARLRHKESDRAAALCGEFGRLGVQVLDDGDALRVRGGPVAGGQASSRGDHRIAMALAVAALAARGPVDIDQDACVAKSWDGFFAALASLGAAVQEV